MGWGERANPYAWRNRDRISKSIGLRAMEIKKEEYVRTKVYAKPMNYLQAFAVSIMRNRRAKQEQREVAKEAK